MTLNRRPPKDNVRRVQSHGLNLRSVMVNKEQRSVQSEYYREDKLAMLLNRDRTVRDFVSQPEEFRYWDRQGKLKTNVPAYKVWRTDGTIELHETVREAHKNRADIRDRDAAMQTICAERGWLYVVHVEEEMIEPTELANLEALTSFKARGYFHQQVEAAAQGQLGGGKRMPLDILADTISAQLGLEQPQVVAALGYMLFCERLCVDMKKVLIFIFARPDSNIPVWLPDEADAHREHGEHARNKA